MPIEQDHHDKYELYAVCSKRGWPTIPVYASFDSGVVTECLTLDDGPLISKPSGSAEGAGHFERWWPETSSDGSSRRYRGEDGAVATYEQVVDRIAERSVDEPYVLQRLVSDHHEIRELSGVEALSAIRLPTCCFPDGRVEALPLLFFRMGTVPGIACSNMAQGGIGYHIDLETGCLERGAKYNSFETFDTHPTTSKRVVGFRLPFWKETVELCKTVHGEGFPTYPSVGWDVAITDDGPVLVEMNIEWAQVNTPNMRFIGETAYTDCMLAHFRKHWPKNCPPPIEA
jgi:hypothetical protein